MESEKAQEHLCYEKSKNGVYLKVKVVPKSSKNEVVSLMGDRIRVTVRAVPQDGKANAMLEQVIADFFGVRRSDCSVTAGRKASQKTVFITADVATVMNRLEAEFYEKKCSDTAARLGNVIHES